VDYFVWEGGVRLGRVVALPENGAPGEHEGAGWLELDPGRAPRGPSMQMHVDTPNGPTVTQVPVAGVPAAPIRLKGKSSAHQHDVVGPRVLTAAEAAPMRDESILEIRRSDGSRLPVRLVSLTWMQVPARASRTPLPFPHEFWMVGWQG